MATNDIQAYLFPTPNAKKVTIALEELNIPYDGHFVNLRKKEQFAPEFLKISPNNKIPAVLDLHPPKEIGEGSLSVFESAAILQYLAEHRAGPGAPELYPKDPRKRVKVNEWLAWQISGLAPTMGQAYKFKDIGGEPYTKYAEETKRLFQVLDKRLGEYPYIAGEKYSIADIASYPWAVLYPEATKDDTPYPNVKAWLERVGSRPAVKRGIERLDALQTMAADHIVKVLRHLFCARNHTDDMSDPVTGENHR
ncbi:10968_t:CDS:2 [Acaulospora colombiana]|uniref:10968_t:CDS:1 n=1 Tax=Acaulospora colombiana TaxID=27376 RepID=A0ACA9KSI8_9GLOM|nr:10968_t:CDS:2 [Acaulospora colombiana]